MTSRRLFKEAGQPAEAMANAALALLGLFTLTALAGYWFFGLHPENLARFPSSASFYATSFSFFAQTQVWLSGVVLVLVLVRTTGWKWVSGFVLVYALSLSSELAGTNTGFPFGEYRYTDLLGMKWFEHVPVVIPLSWFTMVLPAHILTGRLTEWSLPRPVHWLLTGILLTIWDLALDPAMSYLVVYWEWGVEGAYYGMPWVNLLGWLFTGIILSYALDKTGLRSWEAKLSSRWLLLYYVILFALPFGMLVAAGAWWAAILSLSVLLVVLEVYGRLGSGGSGEDPLTGSKTSPTTHSSAVSRTPEEDDTGHLNTVIYEASHDAWSFFRHHSRSFSFASRLFRPRDRHLVTALYVFCRITDDLADDATLSAERRQILLYTWRSIVRSAYDGGSSGLPWLDDLASTLKSSDLPLDVIDTLIDGVLSDTGRVRIQSVKDLKGYSYSVASTVGIMMCHLFDETDSWKLSRAESLGRAMQITNILRDVKTDLAMDRVYLPADILSQHGIQVTDLMRLVEGGVEADVVDVSRHEAYRRALTAVGKLAEQEYERAWEAIPALTISFGLPVAVAAEVYRGILVNLQSRRYDNLSGRARTNLVEKIWLAIRGLTRYGWCRVWPNRIHAMSNSTAVPYNERRQ